MIIWTPSADSDDLAPARSFIPFPRVDDGLGPFRGIGHALLLYALIGVVILMWGCR